MANEIRNGSGDEWRRLLAWMDEHPQSRARLRLHGGRLHTGYLTAQQTTQPGGVWTLIRVRDSSRGSRSQYQTPHDLVRLEIKVGERYRPAYEVVA